MLTFPIYLVSGKCGEMPMLLKAESMPVAVPLFSCVEFAGAFLVQSGMAEDSEVWRIESATVLKQWLDRVAGNCDCVPWDLMRRRGEWSASTATGFREFLAAISQHAASEQVASEN
jgi:hypothetical protein